MSFSSFNLHARVLAGIPKSFLKPTPIQEQALPHVMTGKDVLGLAQTGTGKTAAFVWPTLHRLLLNSSKKGVRALVIAPTRELAEQIRQCVDVLGAKTGLSCACIYGGVSMGAQVHRLRRGVDIIVACPGRLVDHIQQRTIDLRSVEVLVLDEADQMFDMGFLPSIRRIINALPKERQTLLFSATMPQEIASLAAEALSDPIRIKVGNAAPVETVSHALFTVDQGRKTDLLLELLKGVDCGSVLVFTRTKHRAKRLGAQLQDSGYSAASLQGNLSQQKRQAAMTGFRSGKYQVLVATDIAARGIDIEKVGLVVNFDIPNTVEAYTHRIGRTGRAERSGQAYTFVTAEDRAMVRSIERVLGGSIERKQVPGLTAATNQGMPKKGRSFIPSSNLPRHGASRHGVSRKGLEGQGVKRDSRPAAADKRNFRRDRSWQDRSGYQVSSY